MRYLILSIAYLWAILMGWVFASLAADTTTTIFGSVLFFSGLFGFYDFVRKK